MFLCDGGRWSVRRPEERLERPELVADDRGGDARHLPAERRRRHDGEQDEERAAELREEVRADRGFAHERRGDRFLGDSGGGRRRVDDGRRGAGAACCCVGAKAPPRGTVRRSTSGGSRRGGAYAVDDDGRRRGRALGSLGRCAAVTSRSRCRVQAAAASRSCARRRAATSSMADARCCICFRAASA